MTPTKKYLEKLDDDQDKQYRHFVLKSNQEKHKEWNKSQVYVENKNEITDNISNRTLEV